MLLGRIVIGGAVASRTDDGWGLYENRADALREYRVEPAAFGPAGVDEVTHEGSGAVSLVADVDLFSDAQGGECASDDNIVLNEVLVKDVFAWLAVVAVPATTTTAAATSSSTTTTAAAAAVTTPRFTG